MNIDVTRVVRNFFETFISTVVPYGRSVDFDAFMGNFVRIQCKFKAKILVIIFS